MNRKSVSVGLNRYEEKRYNQFLRKLQKPFEFYSLEQKTNRRNFRESNTV